MPTLFTEQFQKRIELVVRGVASRVNRFVSDFPNIVPLASCHGIDSSIGPKIVYQRLELFIDVMVAKDRGLLPNHLFEGDPTDLSGKLRLETGQGFCQLRVGVLVEEVIHQVLGPEFQQEIIAMISLRDFRVSRLAVAFS